MILLKQIQLKDFLSHEDSTIDFSPTAKMIIDGVSGAGKSSVVDAILWSIYGEGRTGNRDLVRRGAKKAEVILTLLSDEHGEVRIVRSMTSAGKHDVKVLIRKDKKFFSHEITGVKALQHWIEHDLIGASKELFVNSVAYLQGGGDLFVSQPASRRKDLLLEIIKAEDYDSYYDLAREKIQALSVEAASLMSLVTHQTYTRVTLMEKVARKEETEKRLSDVATEAYIKEGLVMELTAAQEQRVAADRTLSNLKEKKSTLDIELANLERDEAGKAERRARAKTVEARLKENDAELAGVKVLYEAELALKAAANEIRSKRPGDAYASVDLIPRQIDHYKATIELIASGKQCPSGKDCPFMHDAFERSTESALKVAELDAELVAARTKIEEWEKLAETVVLPEASVEARYISLQKDSRALALELASLTGENTIAAERIEIIRPQIESLSVQISDAEALLASLPIHTADLHVVYGELMHLRSEVSRMESELRAIVDDEKTLAQIVEEIVTNEAKHKDILTKIERLELVKDAFGAKGIRSIVIDHILPRLEERVNSILSKLSEFTIRFDTQTSKTDGGMKEGLFITIVNDVGEELPFEAYSGGERLKITVAISEALATLQNVKFRIFDELFIGLDEDSTQNFSFVLERLQEDFPQILCISHLRQIKDMFPDTLTITKYNGISSIIK